MKSGVRTSEFWVTAVMGVVTAVMGVLVANGLVSGELSENIEQVAGLAVGVLVPLVLGWLGVRYTQSRTQLKLRELEWRNFQSEPVHPLTGESYSD